MYIVTLLLIIVAYFLLNLLRLFGDSVPRKLGPQMLLAVVLPMVLCAVPFFFIRSTIDRNQTATMMYWSFFILVIMVNVFTLYGYIR